MPELYNAHMSVVLLPYKLASPEITASRSCAKSERLSAAAALFGRVSKEKTSSLVEVMRREEN